MHASPTPARKVVTRSPARTVRLLHLPGLFKAPVECESSLERDFVYRASLCPGVADIRHQPFQLTLASGRRYTPDFLVTHSDGVSTVVEVKPAQKIEAYEAVFAEAAQRLAAKAMDFLVLDERSIRHDSRHRRAALILRYRKGSLPPPMHASVLGLVDDAPGGIPVEEVCHRSGCLPFDLFHLIAARRLRCGRDLQVTGQALVYPMLNAGADDEFHLAGWFDAAPWPAHAGADACPE